MTHQKKLLNEKFIVVLSLLILMALAVLCAFMPKLALGADYPGADEQDIVKGSTASTDVNVKIDDEQLSFTAPSIINFAMKGDGTFICPDDNVAYIKNNSVMGIKVKKYEVASDSEATGVADLTKADAKNSYFINIQANDGGTKRPFSVSSTAEGQVGLGSDWIMEKSGTAGLDTLGLRFSDGKMINVTEGTWANPNGHALQKVVWTVSANIS